MSEIDNSYLYKRDQIRSYILKAYVSMKPVKKSLDSLAGKLNLNWPYSPALPQRPKFKYNFPAKVDYTLVKAKPDSTENILLIKNPQFLSNHDETLLK